MTILRQWLRKLHRRAQTSAAPVRADDRAADPAALPPDDHHSQVLIIPWPSLVAALILRDGVRTATLSLDELARTTGLVLDCQARFTDRLFTVTVRPPAQAAAEK